MNISILTPVRNSGRWIRPCVASVANQTAEDRAGNGCSCLLDRESQKTKRLDNAIADNTTCVHHHVQDGGSTDGTDVWLRQYDAELRGQTTENGAPKTEPLKPGPAVFSYAFSHASEPDNGMYHALNKAFAATSGEIVGHLNADEQYLPGTLQFVADYFTDHPKVDVLFGAVVVVDAEGNYICSRMPLKPMLLHTQICHLCTLTASTFFRRSAIGKLEYYFDESFKTAGDADLICRMLRAKLNMAIVRRYFSVFVDSGGNLALSDGSKIEHCRLAQQAPEWAQHGSTLVEIHHRLRKLLSGAYHLKPFDYTFLRANGNPLRQTVMSPVGRWLNRL